MKLVIASGKGGTGKTTLSVALAKVNNENTALLDCDVEEPNCHLFFENKEKIVRNVEHLVPVVDTDSCNGCGKCSSLCQFNAIISFAGADAMVFPDLCHSCGGCIRVCPTGAITEEPYKIGEISTEKIANDKELITGTLSIGHAMAPPIIKEVFTEVVDFEGDIIADAPPGTSCPFVTAAKEADFVIFVTEPTPFGLHDLSLAVDTIREIGTPFGVVVNRIEQADNMITDYCCKNGIEVLLQIKASRYIAEAYSNGLTLVDALPEMREKLSKMLFDIKKKVGK